MFLRHTIFLLFVLNANLFADSTLKLTINYGSIKPEQTLDVNYKEGATALAILQSAVPVLTKKVGTYIFVTSINGLKSQPQKMGWFYQVDGESAQKVASHNILTTASSMRWEYRQDNCLSQ